MIGIRGTHAQHRMTAMTQLLFYVSIAAGINGVANGLALFVTQLSPLSYSNVLPTQCLGTFIFPLWK
jgi:hypothetical protein